MPSRCMVEQQLLYRLDIASLERVFVDEGIGEGRTAPFERNERRKTAEQAQSDRIIELTLHRSTCEKCRG